MTKPILDLEETNEVESKQVVYQGDRKLKGRRDITHILSEKLLPPITKRKVAVYQIIMPTYKDPLLSGNPDGDEAVPYDVVIPGTYMIYDPFERDIMKRDKLMRNVTRPGIEIRDGKQVTVEVVEDIIMYKGLLEVNQDTQYPLYVLMELHPLNRTNRHRDKSKIPVFERIDMKFRSVASLDAVEDLAEDASRTVKEMKIDDVIGYAATLNISTHGVKPDEVRYALRMEAKRDPIAFFKLNPNSEQMVKINFLDALDLGFVEYVMEKKGYRYTTDDRAFFNHAVGEEPVGACVKYLASPKGQENYEKIRDYLGYWD